MSAGDQRRKVVLGPNGNILTPANLPSRTTGRWVVQRKAEVIAAVEGGLLSVEEACSRYGLTLDEFLSWQRAVAASGLSGLQVAKVQPAAQAPESVGSHDVGAIGSVGTGVSAEHHRLRPGPNVDLIFRQFRSRPAPPLGHDAL